jgi:hypothetical protein
LPYHTSAGLLIENGSLEMGDSLELEVSATRALLFGKSWDIFSPSFQVVATPLFGKTEAGDIERERRFSRLVRLE